MNSWMKWVMYPLFLIVTAFVTNGLCGIMKRKEFKIRRMVCVPTVSVTALILLLIGGISVWTVQGIVFSLILLYASAEDCTKRQADDFLWVMILLLAVGRVGQIGIPSMLGGAFMLFVPAYVTVLSRKNSIGGADLKVSAAAGLFLGCTGGVIGYCIGLASAILFHIIYSKVRHESYQQSFPMLPFLSVGFMIGYFV